MHVKKALHPQHCQAAGIVLFDRHEPTQGHVTAGHYLKRHASATHDIQKIQALDFMGGFFYCHFGNNFYWLALGATFSAIQHRRHMLYFWQQMPFWTSGCSWNDGKPARSLACLPARVLASYNLTCFRCIQDQHSSLHFNHWQCHARASKKIHSSSIC